MTLTLRSILLILIILSATQYALFSQGSDSIRSKGLFVGLSLGTAQTQIVNQGSSAVSEIVSNKGNAFSGSAEVGYYFSRYIGLSTGIGYSTYKAQITLANWQSIFSATDSENENFEMRATGTNITEDQKISYLNVPVYLNLRLPLRGKIGLFLQSGINLAFRTGQNYTGNGTFTYKGYYSKYNVLLENLPLYGFPANKATSSQGKPGIESFAVFAVARAGVDFNINEKIQLSFGGTYNKSISTVSDSPAGIQYQLSPAADQINSLMGGSSKVTVQSFGLSLMFRHYF